MANGEHGKPFNLLRWFAWLSPIVIAAIALANAWLISNFLNSHLFQREASISREFVQNIMVADGSLEFLTRPGDPELAARFRNTVEHLSTMRDVLRANVFGQDRSVLWSSDPQLIGRRFADNDELDDAMKGELVVHAGRITPSSQEKREHEGLNPSIEFFVESYIPVKRPDGQVVGVVELYKAPLALSEAINEGRVQVGLTALGSALLLYLTLFWMIRRADSTIQLQHSRLVEAETLAVVGELTSSVAHNIRNPLSSIRSAAELALEAPTEDCSEQAQDIIREVDRISARIVELLNFSGKAMQSGAPGDLGELLVRCVADHLPAFERQGLALVCECAAAKPIVAADMALLRQVFDSLLSNAAEAMQAGGRCRVRLADHDGNRLRVDIADHGAGIAPDIREQVFRPFFTTKPKGLGLGLPLARRVVERYGGTLALGAGEAGGTVVSVVLPRA
ncbi:MAG: two-component sensor histidine kinase [Rhodocyclales bacterium]|nr:two-component sensor histidine kinase [Rhodocyclales bacterium]